MLPSVNGLMKIELETVLILMLKSLCDRLFVLCKSLLGIEIKYLLSDSAISLELKI